MIVKEGIQTTQMMTALSGDAILVSHNPAAISLTPDTVASGKIFDLGTCGTDVFKRIGDSAQDFYKEGVLDHPFGLQPYLIVMRLKMSRADFDEAMTVGVEYPYAPFVTTARLIRPDEDGFWCHEMRFASLHGKDALFHQTSIHFNRTTMQVDPNSLQVSKQLDLTGGLINSMSGCHAVLGTLMLLNTRGVDVEPRKARQKTRKRRIPAHYHVDTDAYITALNTRRGGSGSAGKGSGHTSPIPHLRRGHIRRNANGKTVWIRDMLINVKSADDLSFMERHRSHYKVLH